ncbi:hypothetical protein PHLGIDRAFT_20867 [Phlebiopsis gigantea 11061_1 CR5-6]|uniref:Carbohydrate kinase PfkB domain-containing protein n=1 Tax=Phlebiopsis gigantea (strain 11061_1 CR5-6) TaxID=745531 RepID=A0A0C3P4G0_PHLG1|nr:hypothetical protein PHLGIDRAFT_20867 [Phlebiopsis gigantea 11061_1 CR5-6]
MTERRHLVTLGMFIIDEFAYLDEDGNPTSRTVPPQIGGGGTYALLGARIWLRPHQVGMIVDRGHDFPEDIQKALESFGKEMWLYRDDPTRETTRAINEYKGDFRGFRYLNPKLRLTPRDLWNTVYEQPANVHFICSPTRAIAIVYEIQATAGWTPTTIYEPIPDRCVPEELPALRSILQFISVLSPNAEEALSMLSINAPPTRSLVEHACQQFLDMGVGPGGTGAVIIRSGSMGAFVSTRAKGGRWIPAFWGPEDAEHVVDVTGAGNAFLGGLSAGLLLAQNDIYRATLYAAVSASFIIEQEGMPRLKTQSNDSGSLTELWNDDEPQRRLNKLLLDTQAEQS